MSVSSICSSAASSATGVASSAGASSAGASSAGASSAGFSGSVAAIDTESPVTSSFSMRASVSSNFFSTSDSLWFVVKLFCTETKNILKNSCCDSCPCSFFARSSDMELGSNPADCDSVSSAAASTGVSSTGSSATGAASTGAASPGDASTGASSTGASSTGASSTGAISSTAASTSASTG